MIGDQDLKDPNLCTQSLQAFWSAGQRREDSGDIKKISNFLIGCSVTVSIVLPQKSCGNKIRCPQSLPGVAPLTKKPEDSGYEIEKTQEHLRNYYAANSKSTNSMMESRGNKEGKTPD